MWVSRLVPRRPRRPLTIVSTGSGSVLTACLGEPIEEKATVGRMTMRRLLVGKEALELRPGAWVAAPGHWPILARPSLRFIH